MPAIAKTFLSAGLCALLAALIAYASGLSNHFVSAALAGFLAGIVLRDLVPFSGGSKRIAKEAKLRELEEANRLLRLTEKTTGVGHWRLDLTTEKVFWSAGTFHIHGMPVGSPPPLDEAINMFHVEDRITVIEAIENSRRTGQPFQFRARLVRADGQIRYTQSTAFTEMDDDGQPTALIGVFADRTDEEEMQTDLRTAREAADAMAQAKTTFLATMSHEIRTPMNAVLGFAELLGQSPLSDQQKRFLDHIIDSGRSLQTLLNDILDLTKIDSGEYHIHQTSINLVHFSRRMVQLFEPLAREKSIGLMLDLDEHVPRFVLADALRLRQVLGNLLSNAIRYTDHGGVTLKVRKDCDTITYLVSDTGTGVSPGMLETIFEPFCQDNRSENTRRGGTGLGLSICRKLTRLMGGELSVESELGRGSTFAVTLPLRETSAAAPHVIPLRQSPQEANPSQHRILLAEDYDINQELIIEMGRQLGFEFELARDGQEALDAVLGAVANNDPYSLVLMDVQMPRLNGLDATRSIRKVGIDGEALPIIALTANAFEDDVAACRDAGMQYHVAKPIQICQLDDAITNCLKRHEANRTDHEAQPPSL